MQRESTRVEYLVLKRKRKKAPGDDTGVARFTELKCRRAKVENALRWLQRHSPAYTDIEIDEARLKLLPSNGMLKVPTVEVDDDSDDEEDEGPAPDQRS